MVPSHPAHCFEEPQPGDRAVARAPDMVIPTLSAVLFDNRKACRTQLIALYTAVCSAKTSILARWANSSRSRSPRD